MPHAQSRLDPPRESLDPQRLGDAAPSGLMDSFWHYLALAMGIPPFPFFRADAVAPEGRGT